ncbi:Flp pilus assembly protein CpaB [Shewanella corallii]|uniref:Flp pilus assembly protein CpaB n=1 Tax=Shewanella corallii TaxID=560080 RepID=A0ABT0N653_9GAMM|nr:Flp pilus assembly protein CpaB [Shewanella corallii]MCL2913862.1 Flp pilus assembly protein CpaB [Shewanella corallii]
MARKLLDYNWILLFVALVLGGASAWMAKNYFEAKERELIEKINNSAIRMADVIVATQPLQKGDVISRENMSVRQIREDTLPLDAIHPSRFAEINGEMLLETMAPGRPLLETYLPSMTVAQFSDLLKPGERAVTIDVDDINSTAGMLVPSDHVDLMLVFDDEESDKRKRLQLLLENVTVLATGRRSVDIHPELADTLYDNPSAYNTVTLAMTIDDAARVSLARDKGSFVTLLRNQQESQPVEFISMHDGEIFEPSDNTQHRTVEMIIGGSGLKITDEEYALPDDIQDQLSRYQNNSL